MSDDKWVQEPHPPATGWYAILYCYDAEEGIFPTADYWNGKEWNQGYPVVSHSPESFKTFAEAYEWADMHDL